MLQLGDEGVLYSIVFIAVLLGTRNSLWAVAVTASFYFFMVVFRFPQVPASRVRQVLHPSKRGADLGKVSVVAHRGGGHDAPENTLAAIREVSRVSRVGMTNDACPRSHHSWLLSSSRPVRMGRRVWSWTWSSLQMVSRY